MRSYVWRNTPDSEFREVVLGAETPGGEPVDRCVLRSSDIEDLFGKEAMRAVMNLPVGRAFGINMGLEVPGAS